MVVATPPEFHAGRSKIIRTLEKQTLLRVRSTEAALD